MPCFKDKQNPFQTFLCGFVSYATLLTKPLQLKPVLKRKYLRTVSIKMHKADLYSQPILLEDSLTQCGCFAKGWLGLIRRTEKYRTPTGSCSRRSKQTAHDATRRSVWRLWHCTLGRLALLFRLLSLPQPFRSTLFSSRHKQWDNNVTIIHSKHRGTIMFVKEVVYINMKLFLHSILHFAFIHKTPQKTSTPSNTERLNYAIMTAWIRVRLF